MLNTFCYTGGFSVYALSGGAEKVCSVDSSERAVALATENMALNFGKEADCCQIAADAVDYLKDIGDKYDLIILDPPAFAKHHKVLGNAMQGYKRLNARALSQIRPGGILFTFSCSQAVTKELFRTTVFFRRRHRGPQGAHPAPADPAGRPSDQHLPPRRRIPQGAGVVRGIGNRLQSHAPFRAADCRRRRLRQGIPIRRHPTPPQRGA